MIESKFCLSCKAQIFWIWLIWNTSATEKQDICKEATEKKIHELEAQKNSPGLHLQSHHAVSAALGLDGAISQHLYVCWGKPLRGFLSSPKPVRYRIWLVFFFNPTACLQYVIKHKHCKAVFQGFKSGFRLQFNNDKNVPNRHTSILLILISGKIIKKLLHQRMLETTQTSSLI